MYGKVERKEEGRVMGLYVKGEEWGGWKWVEKVNFEIERELEFKWGGGEVKVKRVGMYKKGVRWEEVVKK